MQCVLDEPHACNKNHSNNNSCSCALATSCGLRPSAHTVSLLFLTTAQVVLPINSVSSVMIPIPGGVKFIWKSEVCFAKEDGDGSGWGSGVALPDIKPYCEDAAIKAEH